MSETAVDNDPEAAIARLKKRGEEVKQMIQQFNEVQSDEDLEKFIALCKKRKAECEERMAAYHNKYPNLLCINKQTAAGVEHCVCYAQAPSKKKKKNKKIVK